MYMHMLSLSVSYIVTIHAKTAKLMVLVIIELLVLSILTFNHTEPI